MSPSTLPSTNATDQEQPARGSLAVRALTAAKTLALALLASTVIALLLSAAWLYESLYWVSLLGHAFLIAVGVRIRPRFAFLIGSMAGTMALTIAFHWSPASIAATTNLTGPWPVIAFMTLIIWESFIFGWFLYFVSRVWHAQPNWIWLAPLAWVTLEYMWPRVFTWAIAHTHTQVLPILQLAEFTGTSGVSALLVLVATALAMLFAPSSVNGADRKRLLVDGICALGFVAATYGWGVWRVKQVEAAMAELPTLRMAAIQIDPSYNNAVDKLRQRSLAVQDRVDLILWPESALGHYHESLDHFRDKDRTAELSEAPNPAEDPTDGFRVPLIAGGKTYREGGRNSGPYSNMAFLIDTDKTIIGRYAKRTLMPVGEYIPGGSLFPYAQHLAALDMTLLTGSVDDPLRLPSGAPIGALICYEDMIRDNSRRTVLKGAGCLVAIINGSGFRAEDTLAQHFRLAMLRSIENRRSFVRCAATGVSCHVTASGRIEQRLPLNSEGELIADVPLASNLTWYTRYGEWFTWLAIGITVLAGYRVSTDDQRRSRTP